MHLRTAGEEVGSCAGRVAIVQTHSEGRVMSKAIVIDGKTFRERRGKVVEVPPEWVGKIPHDQTIRKRQSKRTKKSKKK